MDVDHAVNYARGLSEIYRGCVRRDAGSVHVDSFLNGLLHSLHELGHTEWLGYVIECASLQGRKGINLAGPSGQHYHAAPVQHTIL